MNREDRRVLWNTIISDMNVSEIFVSNINIDLLDGLIDCDVMMLTRNIDDSKYIEYSPVLGEHYNDLRHQAFNIEKSTGIIFYSDYKDEEESMDEYRAEWRCIYKDGSWLI